MRDRGGRAEGSDLTGGGGGVGGWWSRFLGSDDVIHLVRRKHVEGWRRADGHRLAGPSEMLGGGWNKPGLGKQP